MHFVFLNFQTDISKKQYGGAPLFMCQINLSDFFLIEFLFAVYHVSVLRNMCFQTKSLKKRIILLFTIQEICLSDPPVVMTLVDGPTGDSDNMICVAYRHQFDLVNESTGESYRLHHIEANKVSFQHRNCFLAEPH